MLQGSLENFALDEVLGLLSGTSKTGQLEIAGNRGTGSVMFNDGRVVDGTASYTANGTELEDVMFELLRYAEGTFTFTIREVGPGESPENVAKILAAAETRLRDWRSIEAVVPSLNHQITPVAELPADEVTITRDEWAALNVIAAGCAVSLVCDKLKLGEVEGSRQIKNLAERKLVTVTDPIAGYGAATPSTTGNASAANGVTPAPERPAVAEDAAGPADADVTAGGPALGSLIADRPPMPPAPVLDDPAANGDAFALSTPPAPPSPAEVSRFSEELADAPDPVESGDESRGGILSRYLKGDD